MSSDTQALLEAFEHLPVEEKRAFTEEVLRRSLPFSPAHWKMKKSAVPPPPCSNPSR